MTSLCVIIGAGPGLGQAVARRFGGAGMHIALLARSAPKLQGAVDELAQAGIAASAYAADAGDLAALAATLAQVVAERGVPEVLIYNAVAASRGPLSTLAADTLLADLTVSAAGALVAVQAVLPAMRERGKGTIVFTGGGAAVTPLPNTTLSIGKAALRMLALGLAQELEGSGLRVGTVTIYGGVAPGTPFDPDRIAEAYWAIHTGSAGSDGAEVSFRGANA